MGTMPDPEFVSSEGVSDVEIRGNRLRVTCTDSRVKAGIVADLVDAGHDVVDVGSESASLEELFAVYTNGGPDRMERDAESESAAEEQPSEVVA